MFSSLREEGLTMIDMLSIPIHVLEDKQQLESKLCLLGLTKRRERESLLLRICCPYRVYRHYLRLVLLLIHLPSYYSSVCALPLLSIL